MGGWGGGRETIPNSAPKTAKPKADKYPTSPSSLFNCCLSVVLSLENSHAVFCHDN